MTAPSWLTALLDYLHDEMPKEVRGTWAEGCELGIEFSSAPEAAIRSQICAELLMAAFNYADSDCGQIISDVVWLHGSVVEGEYPSAEAWRVLWGKAATIASNAEEFAGEPLPNAAWAAAHAASETADVVAVAMETLRVAAEEGDASRAYTLGHITTAIRIILSSTYGRTVQ